MLKQKGFPDQWNNWIYGCISTVGYSVMINGRQRGYIQATRGIREGDPLSPFLFVLAMYYLSSLNEDAQQRGLIIGFMTRNNSAHISHLLFIDDILLFSVNDISSLQNLRFIIMAFEKASGLKINLSKSYVVGINIDERSSSTTCRIWD